MEHCPREGHALEVEALVLVGDGERLRGGVEGAKLDVLIDAAHLGPLTIGTAVSGEDTIVDEVALVRTSIVGALAILVESA